MDSLIQQYLLNNVDKEPNFILVTTGQKFCVTDNEKHNFWHSYCQNVYNGENVTIGELYLNDDVCFIFDCALVFDTDEQYNNDNLFSEIQEFMIEIIETIQNLLCRMFVFRQEIETEMHACLLQRPSEYMFLLKNNGKNIIYDARILFPNIRTSKKQFAKFAENVINLFRCNAENYIRNIKSKVRNDISSILTVNDDPFNLLYGYSRDICEKLLYYKTYSQRFERLVEVPLEQLFEPECHSDMSTGRLKIINDDEDKEYWLPLYFSNRYNKYTRIEIRNELFEDKKEKEVPEKDREQLRQYDLFNFYCSLINKNERSKNYWSWYDIGCAIYSFDPSERGLSQWKLLTTDRNHYQLCNEEWNNMSKKTKVSVNTLEYFAMKDSPVKYEEKKMMLMEEFIERTFEENEGKVKHLPVAKLFRICFPFEFVCIDIKAENVYHFKDHYFSECSCTKIQKYLTGPFINYILKVQSLFTQKSKNCEVNAQKTRYQTYVGFTTRIIANLNCDSFQSSVKRQCKLQYICEELYKWKDNEERMIGFENGVMDMRNSEIIFRDGKPEDYITKVGKEFPIHLTLNSTECHLAEYYMRQMFPMDEECLFGWKVISAPWISGNIYKMFILFYGRGNNGKSAFANILERMYQNLCMIAHPSYLTEESKPNSPDSTFIRSLGCRYLIFHEPNKEKAFQSAIIKRLTGNDSGQARDLFQKGSDMSYGMNLTITGTPYCFMNDLPPINDCQDAIWGRFYFIPCRTKFAKQQRDGSYDCPSTEEERFRAMKFPMDENFRQKTGKIIDGLLYLTAFKYLPILWKEGLRVPETIEKQSQQFRQENNYYLRFVNATIRPATRVEKNPDGTTTILQDYTVSLSLNVLYNAFQSWFNANRISDKRPSFERFVEIISEIYNIQITYDLTRQGYFLDGYSMVGSV